MLYSARNAIQQGVWRWQANWPPPAEQRVGEPGMGRLTRPAMGRRPGEAGQTTAEWAMIAGFLAAIGVFIGSVVPEVLGTLIRSLALSVRTIAP